MTENATLEAKFPTTDSTSITIQENKTYQISTTNLTPNEWAKIPDNPRQRDTERRLKNATHLISPSPVHAAVSMASCPETNECWKLDGHTRSLLWQNHSDLAPKLLTVTVFQVSSKEEAADLYTHFDNPLAAETPRDRLSGALNEAEWLPTSVFMKNNNFTYGLSLADGCSHGNSSETQVFGRSAKTSIYILIPLWLEELKALDDLNPVSARFKGPVLAAALLTLRRRGFDKAIEFWNLYNSDKGIKLETSIDGVEALTRLVSNTTLRNRGTRIQLAARAISCFENWYKKRDYQVKGSRTVSPKSTDLTKYLKPGEEEE